MFTTINGESNLTQWQLNNKVTAPQLAKGDEVCFSQAGKVVPMKAYESDGVIVADVPNRMLEIAKPILVSLGQGAQAQPSVTTQLEVLEGDMPDGYKFEDNSARELKRSGIDSSEVTQIVKDNFAGGVGYEETTEVVLLPETSFEVIFDDGHATALISDSFPYTFETGDEYTVTFDGETNTYTAVDIENGSMGIASASLEEVFNGNGWICNVADGLLVLSTMDASLIGVHSIIIIKTKFTNKIGDKYIDFKIDKTNPVGEGTFSLNRKKGSGIGKYSFSEGFQTTASGYVSHAEGEYTTASGPHSHAEGFDTTASGDGSYAEGQQTIASGDISHAEGLGTIAASENQHVQGKWSVEDSNNVYAHIIGGGSGANKRKNIHTVDWDGNAWYAGNVEGKALILTSSTTGSTKRFKITVDDTGVLTATEVTS